MISRRRYTALIDANILASMRLTDLFVQLAVDDLYRAKWSVDIHREWMAAVRRFRPDIHTSLLERRRDQMDAETRDAIVTGYAGLIESLVLPDEGDRHVLAAAIVGRCDVIVTFNLKHFPSDLLEPYRLEAQHPDAFLTNHLDLFPDKFCSAIQTILKRHKRKKYTNEEYLDCLAKADLPDTASALRQPAMLARLNGQLTAPFARA